MYTIKQLATLSGVSTRTLRFYDKIGLLPPAYVGDNQYRYYEEQQVLMLQQILFYRELDLPLSEIQQIISQNDFDTLTALETHKSQLIQKIERSHSLLNTIEKTILHIKCKIKINLNEMFEGFNPEKQAEHEQYMLDTGLLTQQQIDASWQRAASWKKSDWEKFKDTGEQINLSLAKAMADNLNVDSEAVQKIIQRHYDWVNTFWTPTKKTYLGLAQMYQEHPDFRFFYNRYHDGLVHFVIAAMTHFAEKTWSKT